VVNRIAADARTNVAQGNRIGILAPEEDLMALAPLIAASASAGKIEVRPFGSRADLDRAGRELFAAIRALDATDVSVILASSPGSDGLARAIRDRLMRAANGRIRTIV
jgi:L-threonylcarbamoyladenylate synthase